MLKLLLNLMFMIAAGALCHAVSVFEVSPLNDGLSRMTMHLDGEDRNIINDGSALGQVSIRYKAGKDLREFNTGESRAQILYCGADSVQLQEWRVAADASLCD